MILQTQRIPQAKSLALRRFEQRMQLYRKPPEPPKQRPGYVIATIFGEFRYSGEKEIGGVSIYVVSMKRRIKGRMLYPSMYFAIWHQLNISPAPYHQGGRLVKTCRSGWRPVVRSDR